MKLNARKNSIILVVLTLILTIFGCVMVYSASKYSATVQYNDQFFYLKKQITGVIIGLVGMIIVQFINNRVYKKFYWVFYIVGLVFLALVPMLFFFYKGFFKKMELNWIIPAFISSIVLIGYAVAKFL